MKRFFRSTIFIALTAFLFLCPLSAQIPSGFVQTTATVPSLANGTYGAAWTNLSSSSQLGLLGCVSTFQTTVNGTIDSKGYFSTLLADTAQICPTPSTWTFTLTFACPGSAFQIAVPVIGGGGTEDITAQITAALPANPCGGSSGGPVSYPSAVQGAIPIVLSTLPAAIKLGNSGIIQTGTPGTSSQVDTFPGSIVASATNGVQHAEQFGGATADVKINACLASIPTGGVCDARGFGATTQVFANTVSCGAGGVRQTLLFDQATLLEPANATTNMFNPNSGCQLLGAHVVLPGGMLYSGKVFVVNDDIRQFSNFRIDNFFIDATAETSLDYAAGYGVYLSASDVNTQSIAFANISNGRCIGLLRCVYATTTGTGFVNGNYFTNIVGTGSGAVIELHSAATGSGAAISGNQVAGLSGEANNAGAGPSIVLSGTGEIWDNVVTGMKLWDVTAGITNTNSNALRNQFFGADDGSTSDTNKELSAFPNQNLYMTTSSFNDKGLWHSLGVGTLAVGGAPLAWNGPQSSLTLGWNFSAGSGESDYFNNNYISASFYSHHWYGANSTNTAYRALGGFTQGGGFILDNGQYNGHNFQIDTLGGGLLGPANAGTGTQAIADDVSGVNGWNFSVPTSSSSGYRFWTGVPGTGPLLFRLAANGNVTDNGTGCGTGTYLLSDGTGCGTPSGAISLSTTGTGGAATLSGGVLNVPIYSGGSSIANTTISISSFAIPANTCYGSSGSTTPATQAWTGLTTAMGVTPAYTGNASAINGWGAVGGLNPMAWPSAAGTVSYLVCNPTSASITGGAITIMLVAR